MRTKDEVDLVLALTGEGWTASEIARHTGIPRSTVRDWRSGRSRRVSRDVICQRHDFSSLNARAYVYLLAMYLGDGCLSEHRRGVWRLRITLDSIYPGIVVECATALGAVTPGKVHVQRRRNDRAVEVSSYWKHWPCFIPQHGPGQKHTRRIALTDWQQRIVSAHRGRFLRGLIHSDGTRIVATERKGGYVRRAARYAFSNRSEDILGLFRAACEAEGIHCTRASYKQIAIYSKAAVARLDEFVGPKA
jgi:hypothetical protein